MQIKYLFIFFIIIHLTPSIHGQKLQRIYDYDTKKWGVRDEQWNVVVPTIYDEIEPKLGAIFAGKKDGKMLLFNGDGTIRVPLMYQHIQAHFNGFRDHFGFAGVTKNDKVPNSWGMIYSDGTLVLPEKYQYVRALSANLLVAKIYPDTLLQFFNGKGEHLFDIPGRTVEPNDYDPIYTFDLQRNDHKTVVYRMDGTLLYPEDPEHAKWTDGQRVILWKETKGALSRIGMIDKGGNELIPFEFSKITPVPSMHHFVVWFQHSDNYLESEGGVFGEKGEVIIPINHHEITAMDGCYLVHDLKKDKKGIYGGNGEIILPVEYHFGSAYDRIKQKHSDKYGVVTDQNTYETFLVSKNGQIFRPVGSVAVSYFSDIHPFIVEVKPDNGSIVRKYKLVNESGIEILPADYTFLEVTSEPSVFIGVKELYGKKGLIDINAPQKTEFKYANTSQMDNGIFYGTTDDGAYEIFNKKLGKIFEGKLSYIKQPQKEHFEKFRSDWQCKNEKMVVVIRTPEMQGSEWAGISENGCVSYFKDTRATKLSEKDKVEMAKTENLDVTHEKEILEELPGSDAAEPLKSPEVSPKSDPITDNDEIFTMVEKMPEFPGGDAALYGFLAKNLIYPNIARENGIQGRVIASFIVEKDGSLSNIQIVRGIGGGCQEEVLRLISLMPKWTPAKHQGVVVRCKSTFPVKFSLN